MCGKWTREYRGICFGGMAVYSCRFALSRWVFPFAVRQHGASQARWGRLACEHGIDPRGGMVSVSAVVVRTSTLGSRPRKTGWLMSPVGWLLILAAQFHGDARIGLRACRGTAFPVGA